MKPLNQWFDEYSVSHQNPKNKAIHFICVPAIFFSIVGILMSIPSTFLTSLFQLNQPLIENWAFVALIFVMIFYFRLSISMAIRMTLLSLLCLIANFYISKAIPLFIFSIVVFTVAWIGQFYGHKIEGKKPSFFKDLQFLLIGPAWVMENIFSKK